ALPGDRTDPDAHQHRDQEEVEQQWHPMRLRVASDEGLPQVHTLRPGDGEVNRPRQGQGFHEAKLLPRMAQRWLDFPETVSLETGSGWQESSDVRIELRRPSLA